MYASNTNSEAGSKYKGFENSQYAINKAAKKVTQREEFL